MTHPRREDVSRGQQASAYDPDPVLADETGTDSTSENLPRFVRCIVLDVNGVAGPLLCRRIITGGGLIAVTKGGLGRWTFVKGRRAAHGQWV
ncbi:MAG: hypothetical protein M1837_006178 [Sclerophora amabilis]|nr:MAG: hypothetical protein M1837_006178 [Sclerophora amabilis]